VDRNLGSISPDNFSQPKKRTLYWVDPFFLQFHISSSFLSRHAKYLDIPFLSLPTSLDQVVDVASKLPSKSLLNWPGVAGARRQREMLQPALTSLGLRHWAGPAFDFIAKRTPSFEVER
jgi:hypothetical protein